MHSKSEAVSVLWLRSCRSHTPQTLLLEAPHSPVCSTNFVFSITSECSTPKDKLQIVNMCTFMTLPKLTKLPIRNLLNVRHPKENGMPILNLCILRVMVCFFQIIMANKRKLRDAWLEMEE